MSELALKLIAENKKTRATFLDLGNCGLTEIPDEIGDLVWLESLSFASGWWDNNRWNKSSNITATNNIIQINDSFYRLKNLKKIWLNGEFGKPFDFTDLSTLVSLNSLQELIISNTKVSNLSPIASLSNLQTLDIGNTQVADLSPLSGLINLQRLNIFGTEVSDLTPLQSLIENGLPVLFDSVIREKGIYIKNCPLNNPPIEIVQQGNTAILNFFREKQAQAIGYLYEAKLFLVGDGGTGKTSLLRRLYQTDLPLPEENEATESITIYQHEFNCPNGQIFRLNVWDFSGQEIYYATHQFFLTQHSLYVLLDDTSRHYDQGFKYWLETVDLLSNHSPVLIFQNEKDGYSKDINFTDIQSKFSNVKAYYKGNLQYTDSVDTLRKAIEFFVQELPHIGNALPVQWLAIRADIEQQAKQQPTISLQDYFTLYQKHLPFDRAKALSLSHYLHDLGVFLHFQDDKLLVRTIILQNHWATKAVFRMLDDEKIKTQWGRFTDDDCERLWQDFEYANMHPELLALMQKFELCYLLRDSTPETWLIPQLLPQSKPNELNNWEKAGDLVLRYRYEFLPKSMINRLIVRQHRFIPRPEFAWLTGGLFERTGSQVLVEMPLEGSEIMLRARGVERKELLSVITASLDALNEMFNGLPEKIVKLIPCYCELCCQQTQPQFFVQQELLQRKKNGKLTIECPASYETVSVLKLLDDIYTDEPSKNRFSTICAFVESENQYISGQIRDFLLLQLGIRSVNSREECNFLLFELTNGIINDNLRTLEVETLAKNILFYCSEEIVSSLQIEGNDRIILKYSRDSLASFFKSIETWVMVKL